MSNVVINPYNFAVAGGLGAWKELGRITSGGSSTTMNVSGLADKRYLQYILWTGSITNNTTTLRLNGDSGANYSTRESIDGGADTTDINTTDIYGGTGFSTTPHFSIGYVSNLAAQEKLVIDNMVIQNTAGSGTSPRRINQVSKWDNTSNSISAFLATNGANFPAGAELIINGYDPTDTHTTADNFWEELASVSSDGSSNTLSASITSKKYLWVQCYEESSAGSVSFRVGNTTLDSANNYAATLSSNGGAEDSTTGIDAFMGLTSTTPIFWNFFIINNSANEKLAIGEVSRQTSAGAGNPPSKVLGVYKWANTSNQIDILGFVAVAGGATILSNSTLKIWGHD